MRAAAALDDAARRAARALDAADAELALLAAALGGGRPDRAVEQPVQQLERLPQLERALLETGLDVARRRARGTAGSKPS